VRGRSCCRTKRMKVSSTLSMFSQVSCCSSQSYPSCLQTREKSQFSAAELDSLRDLSAKLTVVDESSGCQDTDSPECRVNWRDTHEGRPREREWGRNDQFRSSSFRALSLSQDRRDEKSVNSLALLPSGIFGVEIPRIFLSGERSRVRRGVRLRSC